MERAMKNALSYRREAYRLWFEYLRVALRSSNKDVQDALKRSALLYAPWGDVSRVRFDAWWKDKRQLFENKNVVRVLAPNEKSKDPQALVVEIPLTESATRLTKQLTAVIRDALEKQERQPQKRKGQVTAQYRLSAGAEPKLVAVREALSVYRDVYLKNRNLRGSELLEEVHAYYRGRRNKRFAKVPSALQVNEFNQGNEVALRNLRRYITKAERIIANVAKGEFPGKY
jgi:hypothetical protein